MVQLVVQPVLRNLLPRSESPETPVMPLPGQVALPEPEALAGTNVLAASPEPRAVAGSGRRVAVPVPQVLEKLRSNLKK